MGVVLVCTLLLSTAIVHGSSDESPYAWKCEGFKCRKIIREQHAHGEVFGLEACKLMCNEYGALWPRPSDGWRSDGKLSTINLNNIKIESSNKGNSDPLLDEARSRFQEMVFKLAPESVRSEKAGNSVFVDIKNEYPNITDFSLKMDESYRMKITKKPDGNFAVDLSANNFFGVRHGLETLSQLLAYDEVSKQVKILHNVEISDRPVFTYRGLLIDTSRNYYTVESIKKTVNAMAVVKLNTLHWHITDAQSFPFVSERRPELSKYGAYSPEKVYNRTMIKDIVRYARARGIRVMPELDAPAHVGEGWQKTDLINCFNAEPWSSFCVEPPCGQFDPSKEKVYDYIEDIYADLNDAFKPDVFHMGGDEVDIRCWSNISHLIEFAENNRWQNYQPDRTLLHDAFLKLWEYFQVKAEQKAMKVFGKDKPFVLWTSKMTASENVDRFLDNSRYIIQVWTEHGNKEVTQLLNKGYKLILSYYDYLYLDCGFGSWVGSGNNWCTPYKGWNKIYHRNITTVHQQHQNQIYGGEAALWSEQSDSSTVDGRVWPRVAAFAEMFWANPEEDWTEAQSRMLGIRERLVRLGVNAESLQPEWCAQNDGYCS